MDFLRFLYAHFPHRWLDSRAAGTKRLFNGLFLCIEYAEKYVDLAVRNGRTRTAEELLPELEDEYGLATNPSLDIQVRRGKIIAQKRAQDWPVTKEQLLEIFGALGVSAHIQNYHNEHRLEFNISNNLLDIPLIDIYGLLDANVRAHVVIGVAANVEGEISSGIAAFAASRQSIEYENTALEYLHELYYCASVPALVYAMPSLNVEYGSCV